MRESCFKDRYELQKFLLINTAAVRQGIKPGELLRVGGCPEETTENMSGGVCHYQREMLDAMELDYVILRTNQVGVLVLFYHKAALASALSERGCARYLSRHGYAQGVTLADSLHTLRKRFAGPDFPHEVGLFIGYPLKDVVGFMNRKKCVPVYRGGWQVYGNPEESLSRMQRYKRAAVLAETLLNIHQDFKICMRKLTAGTHDLEIHQKIALLSGV